MIVNLWRRYYRQEILIALLFLETSVQIDSYYSTCGAVRCGVIIFNYL
jgi:hypothetical protein